MIVNYTFFYHGFASSNHFTIATRFEIHTRMDSRNELKRIGEKCFFFADPSVCEDKLRESFSICIRTVKMG